MPWWGYLLMAGGAAAAAYLLFQSNAVKVLKYECKSEKLPEEFDNFVIAHVSDYHNKSYGKDAKRIIGCIKNQNPDIIAITGDMIHTAKTKHAEAFIREAVKICPVYYVSGNHEKYVACFPQFKERLKEAGVIVLDNEFVTLNRNGEYLRLSGIIDPRFYPGDKAARVKLFYENVKALTDPKFFNLMLSHRPELMKAYVEAGCDLVLTGHAHAGQVRLPFYGAIFTPGEQFKPKYIVGRYFEENTTMIVSGGLGSSSAVPRINNRPQLLICTLKSEKKEQLPPAKEDDGENS